MKTNQLFIVLFLSFTNVFGYTQLRVGDPRNSWQTSATERFYRIV